MGAGISLILLAAALGQTSPPQEPERRVYAVIVGNNQSDDPSVPPLAFADDDAVNYYELFTALGAQVSLFALLDADAQARFPEATRASRAPRREDVIETLRGYFAAMRAAPAGSETIFYFVYSGHGGLGPNREGYLNLLDGRFGRSDLYREVIGPSPATWNHIIIDACHAYFLVAKKGGEPDRAEGVASLLHTFFRSEDLASYPNTGVILASTSTAETHEWARWRAGVFSHELRSALLGGGDVDGDGRVTYAEAASAVEAANAAVTDPAARLRVYARPPPARLEVPLVDLRSIHAPRLRVEGEIGAAYVEDNRGLRLLDVHPERGESVEVVLLGVPPMYVRTALGEARLPAGDQVATGELPFEPLSAASRGAVADGFVRHLYAVAFGPAFYHGVLAVQGPLAAGWTGWFGSAEPKVSATAASPTGGWTLWTRPHLGVATLGLAALAGATGGAWGIAANQSYHRYRDAKSPTDRDLRESQTRARQRVANSLFVTAGALALAGGALLWWGDAPAADVQAAVAFGQGGAWAGLGASW
jgi:hypothetical protein